MIAGMNKGWKDLRRLVTAQVIKHTARVKREARLREESTRLCAYVSGWCLRVIRKKIKDKTNPRFGYRCTTKSRLGPLN